MIRIPCSCLVRKVVRSTNHILQPGCLQTTRSEQLTLARNIPSSSAPNATLSWFLRTLRNRYTLFSFRLIQQASIQWTAIQKLGQETPEVNCEETISYRFVRMMLFCATAFARGPAMVVVGPGFEPYGWYGPYYSPYPYGTLSCCEHRTDKARYLYQRS